ncbi:DUF222 domain-containing protein [Amycolatopsis pigmentata]|uniref:DUF222 domain-containing protein n=1 Tax=Amycolatopsis pigmentata TaxID=450801 RepID=A0ABW5FTG5_9PSEU
MPGSRSDPPERTRPAVGKVLPWLETGEDTDTLAELEAHLTATLRDLAVTGKPRGGLLRTARRLQAMANQIRAAQMAVIAEFDRAAEQPSNVALEVSLGLAISKHTAQYQIGLAQALTTRLPQTLAAMRRGEIDSWKASRVYEPTAVLSDAKAREVDAIMAVRIPGKDPAGLRRSVNRVVAKVDPEGYAERMVPLLRQFDFARRRLTARMTGPVMDSGDGAATAVEPMTDKEFLWEPVRGRWSVRRREEEPGVRATFLPARWVNQELLHHGAEIALLRDLYRDLHPAQRD